MNTLGNVISDKNLINFLGARPYLFPQEREQIKNFNRKNETDAPITERKSGASGSE